MAGKKNTPADSKTAPSERAPRNMWMTVAESHSDMADTPRRTAKTAETVAAAIVRDIVSRKLRPGDTLPLESEMLAHYRVSRASLREALRILEVQELIRLKPGPGGGPIVSPVDPRNLARISTLYLHLGGATYQELFESQLYASSLCAELAARNPDRDLVRSTLEPFLVEDQPVTGTDYWNVTDSFHGSVEQLAANRVVELVARMIGDIWHVHIVTRMDTHTLRKAIHEEHREIGRAIIAGQPRKASTLMREHFSWLQGEYDRLWPARFQELIEWE